MACKHSERGYALILVLWSLMLLSLIAAMLISQNRISSRLEANAWRQLQAEVTADAATVRGILMLFDPQTHRAGGLYGAATPFQFEGAAVEIAIQDEFGKIDINAASIDLLRALLVAADYSPADADVTANRIVEWRDANSSRPMGAIEQEYRRAGLSYAPRGLPFQSKNELKLVLGMTDESFEKLGPAITVYSQSGAIDPSKAPEIVLRAAPSLSSADVNNILATRLEPAAEGNGAEPVNASGGVIRVPLNGRAFTISVSNQSRGNLYKVETIVRLTGDPNKLYWVLGRLTQPL
jgi:general secretion pathway protein K